MQNKIGEILETVVEPRSGVPILKLNIIDGIKYNTIAEKFFIYINQKEAAKTYSVVFNFLGKNQIESSITDAFKIEFPNIGTRFYYT